MPDTSLCTNDTCPLRDGCLRFTATPNPEWQSYTKFEYRFELYDRDDYTEGEVYCDHYIDINTVPRNHADPNWEPSQGIPSRYMNKL